jgi:hypothetical protein
MSGEVGILNVGAGDTKLSFDRSNPAEVIRASRIVKDMIRRGYALLVDVGETHPDGKPIYRRATDFDENTAEYIIADFDPEVAAAEDRKERDDEQKTAAPARSDGAPEPRLRDQSKPGRKSKIARFDASKTKAVAVAHSAGG